MAEKVQTDLTKKVLADINGEYKEAYAKMLDKKEQYELAKKQESIYRQAMNKYESNFKSNPYDEKAKAQYASAASVFSSAEINTDVLRSSLQGYISFASKMGQSAFIANSTLY